jgi:phospholipid transport system substrate-binding protein
MTIRKLNVRPPAGRGLGHALRLLGLLAAMTLAAVGPARAEDSAARTVVADFQDELLGTMKDATALGFDGRYQKLLPAMDRAFDFGQMTRVVIGGRWSKLDDADQQQLAGLFRQFSVSTYASEFSGYDGESFEIVGERPQGNLGTVVETRLVLKNQAPVTLSYLLRSTDAGPKIVDIYLNGTISELARRRDEFTSVIRNQGLDALIALLKKKNEELARSG